jgi:hypothetical protein
MGAMSAAAATPSSSTSEATERFDDMATGTTPTPADESGLSVSALFVAVGAVATGVLVLDTAGFIGQIERNHGTPFFIALGLTIVGSFLSALATSGLLGRDPDLIALRAAAGQAASDAQELAAKADRSRDKAQASPVTDVAAPMSAAKDGIDAADRIVAPLMTAAASAEAVATVAKDKRRRDAVKDCARQAYERARPVPEAVRQQANLGTRQAAIEAATAAADHGRQLANAANVVAVAMNEALATKGLVRVAAVRHRTAIRLIGAVIVLIGVVTAALVAVRTADDAARPTVDVLITPVKMPGDDRLATRTYAVDAQIRIADLGSESRVTVLVDGLRSQPVGVYKVTNLFHGKYGPNSDGKVDLHARVQVTRGRADNEYDAIGVQAHVAQTQDAVEPNACDRYVTDLSTAEQSQDSNVATGMRRRHIASGDHR